MRWEPNALRASADVTVDDVLAGAVVADPLRATDLSAEADGGCAVVLAAATGPANSATGRRGSGASTTGWTPRAPGVRDLTRSPLAALAAAGAPTRGGSRPPPWACRTARVKHAQVHLLTGELSLGETSGSTRPVGLWVATP
ncbi:MAG: hypothetical protein CM1200mP26_27290 [Acidimicrobiales bacterium]|nr:MAG: hypothetical protein CM1200mP26_27290 [Acidimicrobiales bacterium]